jgi:hypothetical protein
LFELSRIRLCSVGPPGARYEDVLIDLSGAGRPVQHRQLSLFGSTPVRPSPASVLFLENGGGKSVLIKLIFSVMLPGRRQVVGTTNTRVLEKFVEAEDVSHVILEWMHSETGKLLITGKVSEWRGHTVSADVSRLEDKWYYFRPQSVRDLELLKLTEDGRKLTAAVYLERLQDNADANPSLEFFRAKTHEDWTEHLTTLGLDPELFRYQRAMNASEGEAADAFTFTTDRAFVEFLLNAVLSHDELDEVGDALQTHADTLAKREDLVLERDFLAELIGLLEPLAEAEAMDSDARTSAFLAMQKLYTFAGAVARRVEVQKRVIEVRAAHEGELQTVIDTAAREHAEAEDIHVMFERRAAELRVADATQALKSAEMAEEECAAVSLAWDAVEQMVKWGKYRESVAAAERVIGERENAAKPTMEAFNTAARAFRRALMAAVSGAEQAAETELRLAGEVDLKITATEEYYRECLRASAEARALAGNRAQRIGEVHDTARRAQESRLFGQSSTATEAFASSSRELDGANEALELAVELKEQLDERWEQAEQVKAGTSAAVGIAEQKCRTTAEDLARAVERTGQLAGLARLAELLGVDIVDLEVDVEVLVELLDEGRLTVEREQLNLRVEDASEERARNALESGARLLPAPSDSVSVQKCLQAVGIDCWTGWDYIAGIPDLVRRRVLIRTNPLVLGGVVLNDAGQFDEAREVVRAAGLRPTSIVPVTATEAMDGDVSASLMSGDTSWAYFVVPPHPALFDAEAAEAEQGILEQRHKRNVTALDALAAELTRDLELTAQLRQWRADFPPGELARLASAADEKGQSVAAAEREDEETQAALVALQVERRTVRDRLPALRAAVATLEKRHRLLDELARSEQAVLGLERERDEADVTADAQDKLVDQARTSLGTLRSAMQRHYDAASLRSASAQRARSDLNEVAAGGEVTEDEPLPTEPVQVLRDRFDQAAKMYAQVQVGADLRAELATARARLADAQDEVTRHPAEIRQRAEALLAGIDGVDIESRAAARALASRHQAQVVELRGMAQQALADRNADLNHVRKPRVVRHLTEMPTKIACAEELVHLAEAGATELEAHLENLTRDRDRLVGELAHLDKSFASFNALSTVMAVSVPAEQVIPDEPYSQDVTAANQAHRDIMAEVGEHQENVERAATNVSRAADKVAECASASRYEKLAIPVREQITGTLRLELPKHAAIWLDDLRPRLRAVIDDLNQVERHRGNLVVRLQGLVDQALRTLTRAQRMSRLPSSLGDWSGEEFLRIRFIALEGAALAQRLGEVIDEAALGKDASGKPVPRDGFSVLLRGVAAAAPQGFRADMLKPDSVLRNERVPVAGVRDVFSGGQQLTAAIVLYCTMAALRANDRGRVVNPHSGVLFLDNPIGRASAGYLLDLQRGVAEALGVQLIYTTGLFDAEVLADFPVLVRLRNDADIRANRKYLTVEQSVSSHWDSLGDPDETSHLSATRMLVRGRRELDEGSS